MAELESFLHYRIVDVSSIKELARRWFPRIYFNAPEKNGGHRALADILESIRELDYYRAAAFVAPPGPTTEQTQGTAASVVETAAQHPVEGERPCALASLENSPPVSAAGPGPSSAP